MSTTARWSSTTRLAVSGQATSHSQCPRASPTYADLSSARLDGPQRGRVPRGVHARVRGGGLAQERLGATRVGTRHAGVAGAEAHPRLLGDQDQVTRPSQRRRPGHRRHGRPRAGALVAGVRQPGQQPPARQRPGQPDGHLRPGQQPADGVLGEGRLGHVQGRDLPVLGAQVGAGHQPGQLRGRPSSEGRRAASCAKGPGRGGRGVNPSRCHGAGSGGYLARGRAAGLLAAARVARTTASGTITLRRKTQTIVPSWL